MKTTYSNKINNTFIELKVASVASDGNKTEMLEHKDGDEFNSKYLLCETKDTKPVKYLILKPKSLWLTSDGKDVYGRQGNDIQPYPKYVAGEIIKCGFLRDDDKPGVQVEFNNVSYSITLYDINEKDRIRSFGGSGESPTDATLFSRWL